MLVSAIRYLPHSVGLGRMRIVRTGRKEERGCFTNDMIAKSRDKFFVVVRLTQILATTHSHSSGCPISWITMRGIELRTDNGLEDVTNILSPVQWCLVEIQFNLISSQFFHLREHHPRPWFNDCHCFHYRNYASRSGCFITATNQHSVGYVVICIKSQLILFSLLTWPPIGTLNKSSGQI